MNSFRPGLLSWGLLTAIAGATLVYSVTLSQISLFHLVILALTATGLILAIAALIPRSESSGDSGEPSELLDSRVGEQESLDAGGAEVDLGNGRG